MTNISLDLRNRLTEEFDCFMPEIIEEKESAEYENSPPYPPHKCGGKNNSPHIYGEGRGGNSTKKYLLKLSDSSLIEMVFIPNPDKNTLCISTQVGCSRKCSFCATANIGLQRNLTQAELLLQLYLARQDNPHSKITNLVLMGMGEPLDNLQNVISFLKVLQYNEGLAFSGRRTTISTCGIVPKIYEIADLDLKFKLAISLNSAINEKRSLIMPINDIYPLKDLKQAVLYFRKKSNYRVTFEYIMIDDFNMEKEDIKALKSFCSDISCKINLIKWNNVPNLPYKSPSEKQIQKFIQDLHSLPVAITYRKSRGEDIAAACGQLAGRQT